MRSNAHGLWQHNMLYIDLKVNESLRVGDIVITLLQKTGQLARLSIDADKSKEIMQVVSKRIISSVSVKQM